MNSVAVNLIEFHQACLLLPKMLDEEYQALRASIRSGYDSNKPIELFDGKILDGRHRYQACNDEKIEPRFITLTDIDPYDYVRKVHEGRRSWSNQVQKALVIGELLKMSDEFQADQQRIKDEGNRKRAEAAVGNDNSTGSNQYSSKPTRTVVPQTLAPLSYEPPQLLTQSPPSVAIPSPPPVRPSIPQIAATPVYAPPPKVELPEPPKPAKQPERTTAVVAAKIGVNRGAVEQAQTIQDKRPDLAEKVKSGEMKPGEALRQIKKDQVAEKVGALPEGKFRVIYADPPWSYNDKCDTGSVQSGGAEKHYPSMSLAELSAIPIPDRTPNDAVLFLWVTSPLLPDGLKLANDWGFKYKSAFIWDKVKHNMGHYNSVRHEILMICTKGSCTPDVAKLYDSVQVIERSDKHSEKPEEFREIIDTLYPHGPRMELFRRGEVPAGWTVWGSDGAEVL